MHASPYQLGQAKVRHQDVRLLGAVAKQEVLRLEIAVDNALGVQILDGFRHLLGNARGIGFREVALEKCQREGGATCKQQQAAIVY